MSGKDQQKAGGKKSARSPVFTLFSWVFDIGIVVLLIWYFSSPANQSSFWTTIGSWANNTVTVVCATVMEQLKHVKEGQSSSDTSTVASTPVPSPSSPPADQEDPPLPPTFVPPPLPTEEQLASQVPGDCFPPELQSLEGTPEIAKHFFTPPALPKTVKQRTGKGKPIKFEKRTVNGVPFYQVTVDLKDPETFMVIRLPKKSEQANSTTYSVGHDMFETFVKRYPSAAMVNGTFFSKDQQERVMGNMVTEGKSLKYSQWENYGTTLGLREGDYPEMVTARDEGKPDWNEHWFSLTCGPRLVKHGEVWLNPELEGFQDPHVLGCGSRAAIGFNKSRDKIYMITFLRGLSLPQEAKLMKAIGCYEAMNLDGGASKALAVENNMVMKPGRGLTNVLVFYDSKHKAPPEVLSSWQQFQDGHQTAMTEESPDSGG